jgi:hypothetical protein
LYCICFVTLFKFFLFRASSLIGRNSALVYTNVSVGVFTRTPFSCQLTYFFGWSTFGCLAVFPRLKGRTNLSLSFLFVYLVALIINRGIVRSTIIPELCCRWQELFSSDSRFWFAICSTVLLDSGVFVYSVRGFIQYLNCWTTADQACLCTFVCFQKYFNFKQMATNLWTTSR